MQGTANAIGNSHDVFPPLTKRFGQFGKRSPADDMNISVAHRLLNVAIIVRADRIARHPKVANVFCAVRKRVHENIPTPRQTSRKPDALARRRVVGLAVSGRGVHPAEHANHSLGQNFAFKTITINPAVGNNGVHRILQITNKIAHF